MLTCSSSARHKPQSQWEQSEPWPRQGPELLPAPHLTTKTRLITLVKESKNLFGIKISLTFAGVRRHGRVSDVWGVCGLAKISGTFCPPWWWRITWRVDHPRPRLRPPHCKKKKNHNKEEKIIYLSISFSVFIYKSTISLYLLEFGNRAAPAWARSSGAMRLDLSSQAWLQWEGWSYSSPHAGSWCCPGKSTMK